MLVWRRQCREESACAIERFCMIVGWSWHRKDKCIYMRLDESEDGWML
jgi:hypothetical protein